jgi:DNA polymerase III sliding clamp (beta) subunit (PCNA family)
MKFTIKSDNLSKAIEAFKYSIKLTNRNNQDQNIRLVIEEQSYFFYTDTVFCQTQNIEVNNNGKSMILAFDYLEAKKILARIPKGIDINFKVTGSKLQLEYSRKKIIVNLKEETELHEMKKNKCNDIRASFELSAKKMRDIYLKFNKFVSTDDFKPRLQGYCFRNTLGYFELCVTNGFIATREKLENQSSNDEFEVIFGTDIFKICSSIGKDIIFGVYANDKKQEVIATYENGSILFRPIDEKYAPIESVYPVQDQYAKSITIDKKTLVDAIEDIKALDKDRIKIQVLFNINGCLEISFDDNYDNLVYENKIDCYIDAKEENEFKIKFNYEYLLTIANSIKTKKMIFNFYESNKGVLVTNEGTKEQSLLMPCRM